MSQGRLTWAACQGCTQWNELDECMGWAMKRIITELAGTAEPLISVSDLQLRLGEKNRARKDKGRNPFLPSSIFHLNFANSIWTWHMKVSLGVPNSLAPIFFRNGAMFEPGWKESHGLMLCWTKLMLSVDRSNVNTGRGVTSTCPIFRHLVSVWDVYSAAGKWGKPAFQINCFGSLYRDFMVCRSPASKFRYLM